MAEILNVGAFGVGVEVEQASLAAAEALLHQRLTKGVQLPVGIDTKAAETQLGRFRSQVETLKRDLAGLNLTGLTSKLGGSKAFGDLAQAREQIKGLEMTWEELGAVVNATTQQEVQGYKRVGAEASNYRNTLQLNLRLQGQVQREAMGGAAALRQEANALRNMWQNGMDEGAVLAGMQRLNTLAGQNIAVIEKQVAALREKGQTEAGLTAREEQQLRGLIALQNSYSGALKTTASTMNTINGVITRGSLAAGVSAGYRDAAAGVKLLGDQLKGNQITQAEYDLRIRGTITSLQGEVAAIRANITAQQERIASLRAAGQSDAAEVTQLERLQAALRSYTATLGTATAAQQRNNATRAGAFNAGAGMSGKLNGAALGLSFVSPEAGMVASMAAMGPATAAMAGLGVAVAGVVHLTKDGQTEAKRLQQAYLVMSANGIKNLDQINASLDSIIQNGSQAEKMFSKSELAGSLAELARGGVRGADALTTLKTSTQLAAAEHIKLNVATERLYANLQHLDLGSDSAAMFGDKLARASHMSLASMDNLSRGINVLGATAHQMDFTLDEMLAMLVAAAKKGMDPATIGATGLRNAMQKVLTPSKEAGVIYEELGVKMRDSTGHMRSGRDIMMDLQHVFSTTEPVYNKLTGTLITKTDLARMAFQIFGTRSATAFLSILGNIGDLTHEIQDSEGFLNHYSGEVVSGLEGAQKRLDAATKNLSLSFSKTFTPAMAGATEALATFMSQQVVPAVTKLTEFFNLLDGKHANEINAVLTIKAGDSSTEQTLKMLGGQIVKLNAFGDNASKMNEANSVVQQLINAGVLKGQAFGGLGIDPKSGKLNLSGEGGLASTDQVKWVADHLEYYRKMLEDVKRSQQATGPDGVQHVTMNAYANAGAQGGDALTKAFIGKVTSTVVGDPKINAWCADVASRILTGLGYHLTYSNNARQLEKNVRAAGGQVINPKDARQGDVVFYHGIDPSTKRPYGSTSGTHVEVVAGFEHGRMMLVGSNGINGSRAVTQKPFYDPTQATIYRLPGTVAGAKGNPAPPPEHDPHAPNPKNQLQADQAQGLRLIHQYVLAMQSGSNAWQSSAKSALDAFRKNYKTAWAGIADDYQKAIKVLKPPKVKVKPGDYNLSDADWAKLRGQAMELAKLQDQLDGGKLGESAGLAAKRRIATFQGGGDARRAALSYASDLLHNKPKASDYSLTDADWAKLKGQATELARLQDQLSNGKLSEGAALDAKRRIADFQGESRARQAAFQFATDLLQQQQGRERENDQDRRQRASAELASLKANIRDASDGRLQELQATVTDGKQRAVVEEEVQRRTKAARKSTAEAIKTATTQLAGLDKDARQQEVDRAQDAHTHEAQLRDAALKGAGDDAQKRLAIEEDYAGKVRAKAEALAAIQLVQVKRNAEATRDAAIAAIPASTPAALRDQLINGKNGILAVFNGDVSKAYRAFYAGMGDASSDAAGRVEHAMGDVADANRRAADESYAAWKRVTLDSVEHFSNQTLLRLYSEAAESRDQDLVAQLFAEIERRRQQFGLTGGVSLLDIDRQRREFRQAGQEAVPVEQGAEPARFLPVGAPPAVSAQAEAFSENLDQVRKQLKDLGDQYRAGLISTDDYASGVEKLNAQLWDLYHNLQRAGNANGAAQVRDLLGASRFPRDLAPAPVTPEGALPGSVARAQGDQGAIDARTGAAVKSAAAFSEQLDQDRQQLAQWDADLHAGTLSLQAYQQNVDGLRQRLWDLYAALKAAGNTAGAGQVKALLGPSQFPRDAHPAPVGSETLPGTIGVARGDQTAIADAQARNFADFQRRLQDAAPILAHNTDLQQQFGESLRRTADAGGLTASQLAVLEGLLTQLGEGTQHALTPLEQADQTISGLVQKGADLQDSFESGVTSSEDYGQQLQQLAGQATLYAKSAERMAQAARDAGNSAGAERWAQLAEEYRHIAQAALAAVPALSRLAGALAGTLEVVGALQNLMSGFGVTEGNFVNGLNHLTGALQSGVSLAGDVGRIFANPLDIGAWVKGVGDFVNVVGQLGETITDWLNPGLREWQEHQKKSGEEMLQIAQQTNTDNILGKEGSNPFAQQLEDWGKNSAALGNAGFWQRVWWGLTGSAPKALDDATRKVLEQSAKIFANFAQGSQQALTDAITNAYTTGDRSQVREAIQKAVWDMVVKNLIDAEVTAAMAVPAIADKIVKLTTDLQAYIAEKAKGKDADPLKLKQLGDAIRADAADLDGALGDAADGILDALGGLDGTQDKLAHIMDGFDLGGTISDAVLNGFESGDWSNVATTIQKTLQKYVVQQIIQMGVQAALASAGVADKLAALGPLIADAMTTGNWGAVQAAVTDIYTTAGNIAGQVAQMLPPGLGFGSERGQGGNGNEQAIPYITDKDERAYLEDQLKIQQQMLADPTLTGGARQGLLAARGVELAGLTGDQSLIPKLTESNVDLTHAVMDNTAAFKALSVNTGAGLAAPGYVGLQGALDNSSTLLQRAAQQLVNATAADQASAERILAVLLAQATPTAFVGWTT